MGLRGFQEELQRSFRKVVKGCVMCFKATSEVSRAFEESSGFQEVAEVFWGCFWEPQLIFKETQGHSGNFLRHFVEFQLRRFKVSKACIRQFQGILEQLKRVWGWFKGVSYGLMCGLGVIRRFWWRFSESFEGIRSWFHAGLQGFLMSPMCI